MTHHKGQYNGRTLTRECPPDVLEQHEPFSCIPIIFYLASASALPPTCQAGRPDHGSNGAYPSWPAFALEALCYVDGNCSSAFSIMSTFADNTYEGAFGQAHEVPQMATPPYTPLNDVAAFKPIAGVTR